MDPGYRCGPAPDGRLPLCKNTIKSKKQYVTSGGWLGTMGFALLLPPSVRNLAHRNEPSVAIAGDGCFQMTLQELGTISLRKRDLNVKIIRYFNNQFPRHGTSQAGTLQRQKIFFRRYPESRFCRTGKGLPDVGEKSYGPQNPRKGVEKYAGSFGSYLLEIMVGKENNVFS